MKIILIYPPFCSPSTMPHSISYLKSFISQSFNLKIKCLDLNAKFNKKRFKEFYSQKCSPEIFTEFDKVSRPIYSKNNKLIYQNNNPELFKEMLSLIKKESPDLVAFSLVYNSQCFYAQALIQELKKLNIPTLIGGPAVNHHLYEMSTFLVDEHQFADYIEKNYNLKRSVPKEVIPDFSDFDKKDYLTEEIVIPLRTSHSCYYKQCAFCTHHQSQNYREILLEQIKKTIIKSGYKNVFFFDDMISKKRLLELATVLKPLKVKWWCQLRPSKELLGSFKTLYDSGLRSVSWGVESGNQRVLDLMCKGTNITDISKVLKESHESGIKNLVFIIIGFPTETKEELFDSIKFVENNSKYIDLISTSRFGLQRGSKVFMYPEKYGITEIKENSRTILEGQITYKVKSGMTPEDVKKFHHRYLRSFVKINKITKVYNYFKEQTLFL